MGKKKKHPLVGKVCFNQKNEKCKVIGIGKHKSKGLLIVSILNKESKVEKDERFHYAAKPEDLSFIYSPEQIKKAIKKDLEQLCKQAKQQCKRVEFQLSSLKKCKEAIKPKYPRYGPYRLNPKRFGQMTPQKISKKFRKEAREIEEQVNIQFNNLKVQRVAAKNTTSEILAMRDSIIRNLTLMGIALEGLPKQIEDAEHTSKLYNYERRREIELFNKTLGKDLALSQKPVKSRGQKKGANEMASKKDAKGQIQSLLRKLEKAEDTQEKREIRSELRKLGHKGGLGKGAGRPKKAKKVTKKKKKAKKKSAA